ncbi:MAG: diaminopimelate epimerase [Thermodesulfovibrionales bacterium]|nr:diaminopimelate epimerase [Thermodesulfovibrionales bacterium]
MKINFTKMHGLGNDFILIDCRENKFEIRPPEAENFEILAKKLCNRRFGIGADQLLLLYPSEIADFKMRIFNADGSEVEMCGNGIRCLAKYIWDRNLSDKKILHIETLVGIIKPEKSGDMVKVDMGEPTFEPEKIPVRIVETSKLKVESSKTQNSKLKTQNSKLIIDCPLQIKDREFRITCVSMGNPHTVIVVEDISHFPVTYYGPLIESQPIFPKRTNVEFIEVLTPAEIKMRVWERGSGETMACGTGASAAAVASNIKGLTGKNVTVHLPGGDLFIEWAADNHVYIIGPAVEIFEGIIENQR